MWLLIGLLLPRAEDSRCLVGWGVLDVRSWTGSGLAAVMASCPVPGGI